MRTQSQYLEGLREMRRNLFVNGEKIDRIKTHIRLHLNYLPCYQPGLNLQERIWRQIRYEATMNRWSEIWMIFRKRFKKQPMLGLQRK